MRSEHAISLAPLLISRHLQGPMRLTACWVMVQDNGKVSATSKNDDDDGDDDDDSNRDDDVEEEKGKEDYHFDMCWC